MQTRIFKVSGPDDSQIDEAAEIIRNGGLVAFPTETVYGLGANAFEPSAALKIFKAKGRPADNPLIVHISRFEQIYNLVSEVPDCAKALAEAYWPGPLTMILPKSDKIPKEVSGGLDTVGIRMPSNPVARALIEKSGCPIAAPSANSSGLPSPTEARDVIDDMNGKIDAIIDGGDSDVGIESTIVTLSSNPPRLLRPGGITHAQLEKVLGKVEIDHAVTEELGKNEVAVSPGMKYKHYSPKAEVYIVYGSFESFVYQISSDIQDGDMALCFDGEEDKVPVPSLNFGKQNDSAQQAHRLFSELREFDRRGAKRVFVRAPSSEGVGLGVFNRLLRAAGFKRIYPPVIYGLTGQSGAGKTTVAELLGKKGYLTVDCDKIAREVTEKGSPVLTKLADSFGEDILENGVLNRRLLAERAFASEEKRQLLNSITHPEITRRTLGFIRDNYTEKHKGVIIDAAAILDCELTRFCTEIIVVTAPEEVRLNRIVKRDNIDAEAALMRIKAQPDEKYYKEHADILICNDGVKALNDELDLL